MSTRETPPTVPQAVGGEPTRFRRYLARRARQTAIAALIVVGFLVVGACGVLLRRATCLIGLPDVGDPFDVAAFRTLSVPDDQNAFIGLRRAADKLGRMPHQNDAPRRAGPPVDWEDADSRLREWLKGNGEALGLFREALTRPDALKSALGEPERFAVLGLNLDRFFWLVMLEISRLESLGDMAAAWDDYRGLARMKSLIMQRGTVMDRFFANQNGQGLGPRIALWAANPKTDVGLIRRALADMIALEPKPEWDAFSLKLQYLEVMSLLDLPDGWVAQGADQETAMVIAGTPLPPNLAQGVYAVRRYLINEPERSRRVLRLAFANWLAHVDERDPGRRKPSVGASFLLRRIPTYLSFFTPGPDAPAAARALSAHELASWVMSARDARVLLFQWPWPAIRNLEQREYRNLVVTLAEELYRRDRASGPPSEEALVGTYLDHLPDDGTSDLDDGTAQRVDELSDQGTFPLE